MWRVLYLPLYSCRTGFDPDSIRELNSGTTLLWQHRYVLSRPPGYFPYEALCGLLYALGGTIASNLATVAISLLLLDSFLHICEHFEVPHRYLLAATMAIQPVYWASSTSTIDFIWALGCFMVGMRLWLDHRYFGAAAMLGLAVGIRLSSVFLAGPFLVWEIVGRPRKAKLWMTAALATAIGAMLYLPEFVASGHSLGFLTYYIGAWTMTGHLGRFVYKNVYFWGLPAAVFFLAIAPLMIRKLARCDRKVCPNHRVVDIDHRVVRGAISEDSRAARVSASNSAIRVDSSRHRVARTTADALCDHDSDLFLQLRESESCAPRRAQSRDAGNLRTVH